MAARLPNPLVPPQARPPPALGRLDERAILASRTPFARPLMRPAFAPFSLVLCAVLAVVLGGCGPTALVAYRPDDPPTVHLPLAQAQIRDARPAFASLFARELADQPETLQAWLHGPGPADANAPLASLSALDERFDAQRAATSVLIVPGLFSDCIGDQSVPFGDGEVRPESEAVRAAYRHYGFFLRKS